MRRYRTEIVIPADRTLNLHLPDSLPPGPAILVVVVDAPNGDEELDTRGLDDHESVAGDLDAQDIEWWDDLDDPAP